ncbi:hypothetical protein IF2G_05190 [Cordyceps javanica]|nr:hypothetical protein IF2G_05190 [Cordyceps javanica]
MRMHIGKAGLVLVLVGNTDTLLWLGLRGSRCVGTEKTVVHSFAIAETVHSQTCGAGLVSRKARQGDTGAGNRSIISITTTIRHVPIY